MVKPWTHRKEEFSFEGYGYTPSEAQKDLEKKVNYFNNKFYIQIEIGTTKIEKL